MYPYLLKGLAIERPNQVWTADITYTPVQKGFLYLVAVMDWATRRVLSWRLSNTLDARFGTDDVLIGRVTNSEWRSRVFSLRYIVTFLVAAAVLPVIAGIHANWGFGALFVVMAVAASGIFAAALMLPRRGVVIAQPAMA